MTDTSSNNTEYKLVTEFWPCEIADEEDDFCDFNCYLYINGVEVNSWGAVYVPSNYCPNDEVWYGYDNLPDWVKEKLSSKL